MTDPNAIIDHLVSQIKSKNAVKKQAAVLKNERAQNQAY